MTGGDGSATGGGSGALLTVGHGRLDGRALAALLRQAGVGTLVDVRRFPGSRSNPEVGRDVLPGTLAEAGIGYRWEQRLGGRRSLPKAEDHQDPWWQVAAFRAYAAHTRTPMFTDAMAELLQEVADAGADGDAVAVMCSESVWWRCHRRLVADVAVLGHGVPVRHLMHDGREVAHEPAEGARRSPDGLLFWDRL